VVVGEVVRPRLGPCRRADVVLGLYRSLTVLLVDRLVSGGVVVVTGVRAAVLVARSGHRAGVRRSSGAQVGTARIRPAVVIRPPTQLTEVRPRL
jgi:hypothetical protein